MFRIFTTFIFVCFLLQISAQQFNWNAEIIDQSSRIPLIGVNVFDAEKGLGSSTNSKGKMSISISNWPVSFEVSYLGYQSQIIKANRPEDLPKKIRLFQDAQQLEEIVISDKAIPKKMTSKWRSVTDFILFQDRILYVETTGNTISSKIYLADKEGEVLDEMPIKDLQLFEGLFLSCQETPYIICEHKVFQLNLERDSIEFLYDNRRDVFDDIVLPCKASDERYLYHARSLYEDRMARITQVNKKSMERRLLTQVFDEEEMRYTVQAMELINLYSRFAKHTNNPFYDGIIAMESGHLETFKQPVDYDIFVVDNTILVLDYENSVISYFNQEAIHEKDVNIYYNQQKDWSGIVLQDHDTQKIYVIIKDKNTLILHNLDVSSGKLNFIAYLDVDIIDKVDIQNGTLWYTASKLTGPEIGKRLHKLDL